ncbi:hypothetical protein Tco_0367310 [Tanacetum coccineum]
MMAVAWQGCRGTPAGGEGKWRVRSGGDGGIWQRREWLVRSYGDSSGGSQMAAGGGMATRGACWYGESGRCRSGGSIFVYWPEIFRWPNDRCGVNSESKALVHNNLKQPHTQLLLWNLQPMSISCTAMILIYIQGIDNLLL